MYQPKRPNCLCVFEHLQRIDRESNEMCKISYDKDAIFSNNYSNLTLTSRSPALIRTANAKKIIALK